MRIRPRLRPACAAVFGALAAGWVLPVQAQSLIESLSTTYNSNPDLLAARATLRQTDETLSQAVANWRPQWTTVPMARTRGVLAGLMALTRFTPSSAVV